MTTRYELERRIGLLEDAIDDALCCDNLCYDNCEDTWLSDTQRLIDYYKRKLEEMPS